MLICCFHRRCWREPDGVESFVMPWSIICPLVKDNKDVEVEEKNEE